ncbi:MAG TPA: hypothetical protein VGH54_21625 [Mycobacterium sp.]|jgi:hypothetical protein|uniref:hypothetical protein n=1 Tax=Mycobacterium sp. TaxID=1785 RepID=UPI002F3E7248
MTELKGEARAAHVQALQNELEMLQHRPVSDAQKRRLGEVKDQLDEFSDNPKRRRRETAVRVGRGRPTPGELAAEQGDDAGDDAGDKQD